MSKDLVEIVGSFYPQGTGAPLAAYNGQDFSVTRSRAGMYLLTFTRYFMELLGGGTAQVQAHTPLDLKTQFGDFTPANQGAPASLVVTVLAVATMTDMAADPNNRIHFHLMFRTA